MLDKESFYDGFVDGSFKGVVVALLLGLIMIVTAQYKSIKDMQVQINKRDSLIEQQFKLR